MISLGAWYLVAHMVANTDHKITDKITIIGSHADCIRAKQIWLDEFKDPNYHDIRAKCCTDPDICKNY